MDTSTTISKTHFTHNAYNPLSDECLCRIFAYCSRRDLRAVSFTCTHFFALVQAKSYATVGLSHLESERARCISRGPRAHLVTHVQYCIQDRLASWGYISDEYIYQRGDPEDLVPKPLPLTPQNGGVSWNPYDMERVDMNLSTGSRDILQSLGTYFPNLISVEFLANPIQAYKDSRISRSREEDGGLKVLTDDSLRALSLSAGSFKSLSLSCLPSLPSPIFNTPEWITMLSKLEVLDLDVSDPHSCVFIAGVYQELSTDEAILQGAMEMLGSSLEQAGGVQRTSLLPNLKKLKITGFLVYTADGNQRCLLADGLNPQELQWSQLWLPQLEEFSVTRTILGRQMGSFIRNHQDLKIVNLNGCIVLSKSDWGGVFRTVIKADSKRLIEFHATPALPVHFHLTGRSMVEDYQPEDGGGIDVNRTIWRQWDLKGIRPEFKIPRFPIYRFNDFGELDADYGQLWGLEDEADIAVVEEFEKVQRMVEANQKERARTRE